VIAKPADPGVLAPPDPEAWRRRAAWFWRAHDINARPVALPPRPRVDALVAELETVFCAGAWAATVILAWALCEIVHREAAGRGGSDEAPAADYDWLRERRNRLIHSSPGQEAVDLPDEAELQAWAEGAVRVAFRALFEGAAR
jgi:hypothetical protein